MIMKLIYFLVSFGIICVLKFFSDYNLSKQWIYWMKWLSNSVPQNLLWLEFMTFLAWVAIYGLYFIYTTAEHQASQYQREMRFVLRDLQTTNILVQGLVDSQTRMLGVIDDEEKEDNKQLEDLERNFKQIQEQVANEETMKQELFDNHFLRCSSIENKLRQMLATCEVNIDKQCEEANKNLQFCLRHELRNKNQIPNVFAEMPPHLLWSEMLDKGPTPLQPQTEAVEGKPADNSRLGENPTIINVDDDELAKALSVALPAWESAENVPSLERTEQKTPKRQKLKKPRTRIFRAGSSTPVPVGDVSDLVQKRSSVTQNSKKIKVPRPCPVLKKARRKESEGSSITTLDDVSSPMPIATSTQDLTKMNMLKELKNKNTLSNTELDNFNMCNIRHSATPVSKNLQAVEGKVEVIEQEEVKMAHRMDTLGSRKTALIKSKKPGKIKGFCKKKCKESVGPLKSQDSNSTGSRRSIDTNKCAVMKDFSIQQKNIEGNTGSVPTGCLKGSRISVSSEKYDSNIEIDTEKKSSNGSVFSIHPHNAKGNHSSECIDKIKFEVDILKESSGGSNGSMLTQFSSDSRESIEFGCFKAGSEMSGSMVSFQTIYSTSMGANSRESIVSKKSDETKDLDLQLMSEEPTVTCSREILDLKKTDFQKDIHMERKNSEEAEKVVSPIKQRKNVTFGPIVAKVIEERDLPVCTTSSEESCVTFKRSRVNVKTASDPIDSEPIRSLCCTNNTDYNLNVAPLSTRDKQVPEVSVSAVRNDSSLKNPIKLKNEKIILQVGNLRVATCNSLPSAQLLNEANLIKEKRILKNYTGIKSVLKLLEVQRSKCVGMLTATNKEMNDKSDTRGEIKYTQNGFPLYEPTNQNNCGLVGSTGKAKSQQLQNASKHTIASHPNAYANIVRDKEEESCKTARKKSDKTDIEGDTAGEGLDHPTAADVDMNSIKQCSVEREPAKHVIRDKADFATEILQLGTRQYCMKVVRRKGERLLKFESVLTEGRRSSIWFSMTAAAEFVQKLKRAEGILAGLAPIVPDRLPKETRLIKSMVIESGSNKYHVDVKENENGRYVRLTDQSASGGRCKIVFPADSVGVVRDGVDGFVRRPTPARSPRMLHTARQPRPQFRAARP